VWWCNRKRRCGILRVGGANVCGSLIAEGLARRSSAVGIERVVRICRLGSSTISLGVPAGTTTPFQ
jgi:hypothetical protein